jgi:hypothetical protein
MDITIFLRKKLNFFRQIINRTQVQKNLAGWHPKITNYDLDDNFGNTFRVKNGLLSVRYDAYDKFDERFGHIFFKEKFFEYPFLIIRL